MKKRSRFHGNLVNKDQGKHVDVNVDIIEYLEDGVFFLYSPALDLVGYGMSEEEARQSWEVVLGEYVSYTMNKKTLIKDLRSRGWKVKRKDFLVTPPSLTWMLENNSELTKVYNNYNFSKRSHQVSLPVSA